MSGFLIVLIFGVVVVYVMGGVDVGIVMVGELLFVFLSFVFFIENLNKFVDFVLVVLVIVLVGFFEVIFIGWVFVVCCYEKFDVN